MTEDQAGHPGDHPRIEAGRDSFTAGRDIIMPGLSGRDDWGGWLDHEAKPADAEFNVGEGASAVGQVNHNYGTINFSSSGSPAPPEERPGNRPSRRPLILLGSAGTVAAAAAVAVVLFTTQSGSPQRAALTPSPQRAALTPSPPHTAATGAPPDGAWCRASAIVYDAQDHKYNISVDSNQSYGLAEVSANGVANHYRADVNGHAVVYLANVPAGTRVTVTIGHASCTTVTKA